MAYEHFYQFYDQLMSDVPYNQYLEIIKRYASKTDDILDVGCGTGLVLIPLLEASYQVDGLDLSDEMLLVTKQKLTQKKLYTNLFQDDMRLMEIHNQYHLAFSFLDTINYLTTSEDIRKTFKQIWMALKDDGYFIFDVHLFETLEESYQNYFYHETFDHFTYLWNTDVETIQDYKVLYHELSFFINEKNDLYQRVDEYHKQVVYPLDYYLKLLEEVGFKIEKTSLQVENKVIIVAKKCLS